MQAPRAVRTSISANASKHFATDTRRHTYQHGYLGYVIRARSKYTVSHWAVSIARAKAKHISLLTQPTLDSATRFARAAKFAVQNLRAPRGAIALFFIGAEQPKLRCFFILGTE